ncbi:MAG: hypothetical protein Ct9H90mP25_4120 [Gammaproteobacteria bacterium]|nr:MAG: hypothetical protein Ct9H90mP25_4120 [Gammaproteobacteria bacterium]
MHYRRVGLWQININKPYPISYCCNKINHASTLTPGPFESITGLEFLDKVVDIDQSPIGRTPRSNPATYTGIFTPVRELFSGTQEARTRATNQADLVLM